MEEMPQGSAAKTFDQIRAGSQTLLLSLFAKLAGIREILEAGEFNRAAQEMARISQLLQPLAMAEQVLGYMGQGRIISGENIDVGMELLNIGKIVDIEEGECDDCAGVKRIAELEDGRSVILEHGIEFVIADDSIAP
jgi:hypothetical protein